MEMVPSQPSQPYDTRSRAEKRVFERLQKSFITETGYTAYHSFKPSSHPYKRFSEIDFLICCSEGLYVIEIKGGNVSYDKGVWKYTNRSGKHSLSQEGPFRQAESALYGLVKTLEGNLPKNVLDQFTIGYGVLFPDCEWRIKSAEWDPAMVADIRTSKDIESWLRRLFDYWRGKNPLTRSASPEALWQIRNFLRPDSDVKPPSYRHEDTAGRKQNVANSFYLSTGKIPYLVEARKRLIKWLREQMIGPENEFIYSISPLDRYCTGVLYPVETGVSGTDPAFAEEANSSDISLPDEQEEVLENSDYESDDKPLVRPIRRKRYIPPSSVGFSFFVEGNVRLSITASAEKYQCKEDKRNEKGRRKNIKYERRNSWQQTLTWSDDGSNKPESKGSPAMISVVSRSSHGGRIFTVTLSNQQEIGLGTDQAAAERVEKSLFNAKLECVIEAGKLAEYPRVVPSLLTEEEQELEFQYKEKHIYAVGHGAAVSWSVESDRNEACIWTEFMPEVEVPKMTTDLKNGDKQVLDLQYLATGQWDDLLKKLEDFTTQYSDWITEQKNSCTKKLSRSDKKIAMHICGRMEEALIRMRHGIDLLRSDSMAGRAFRLANQAMLDQFQQSDRIYGENTVRSYSWRPFQLAFLLTVMKSTIYENDDFRDVLDLIWFPTGGGKTEAYLGLTAFLIVWNRLKYGENGCGTNVLMRYTLRLLTKQQFERATRIICALELIRRQNSPELGEKPISIGLWVGSSTSPNSFYKALEYVEDFKGGNKSASNQLVLKACPWCGVDFGPDNYCAKESSFSFRCNNTECGFCNSKNSLPCNVVDEALYENPPSLLIGTIDKFARLAWEERAGSFFGLDDNSRPPELIIQDELHLITGPLGSVAGIYEAALDTLLTNLSSEVGPKYIASTATIRMAREQVKRLYGRELSVFPPPGLSSDDSFFARTDYEKPGRLYIGYLAPGLNRQFCLAPLAAALLTGPLAVFKDDQERETLLDAWWTAVIYHSSLKSVGESHNTYNINVNDFVRMFSSSTKEDDEFGNYDDAKEVDNVAVERFGNLEIAQITSNLSPEENAEAFNRLEKERGDGHLDVVLASNMISVGLDVDRLALMVVNGQPMTTAEYIQATSRVGRSEVPGLVFANYYCSQARSLSHYENFRPYHESFYRFVEPSAATPYTYQVRRRALHAALVITIRHTCAELRKNETAGDFDQNNSRIQPIIRALKQRCKRASSEQAKETTSHIDQLVKQWHEEADKCKKEKRQLNYKNSNEEKNADCLLCNYGTQLQGLWPTLNSMRNVEDMGALKCDE